MFASYFRIFLIGLLMQYRFALIEAFFSSCVLFSRLATLSVIDLRNLNSACLTSPAYYA